MRDSYNNLNGVIALNFQTISSDTTTAGNEIDMQGYHSITFFPQTGTVTDGDYTILIQESDTSGSGYSDVADADLIGTEADASFTADDDDNSILKIGYIGNKRYVKASVVSTNTSSGAVYGITAVQGHAEDAPV